MNNSQVREVVGEGGGGLEQLNTEELKLFDSFLGSPFQHLLNNLFPTHGKLVQLTASQMGQ